jgi:YwiC-like protein
VLPHEHGGWAFLAEPIVLGFAVAPSAAAPFIALAAIAAFLARQPLVLALADRRRGTRYPRTIAAERAFVILALAGVTSLAIAVFLADGPMLAAVGLAVPLGAIALALDLARKSRALAGELCGAVAMGATVAILATAAGWSLVPALGLWGAWAARAISSVAYVRSRLRLDRGEPAHEGWVYAAQALALVWIGALVMAGLAPRLAVAAMILLAFRAAHGLSSSRVPMTTWQLGITEIGVGLITVFAIAVGMARGW